jgi:hypothetical protein
MTKSYILMHDEFLTGHLLKLRNGRGEGIIYTRDDSPKLSTEWFHTSFALIE